MPRVVAPCQRAPGSIKGRPLDVNGGRVEEGLDERSDVALLPLRLSETWRAVVRRRRQREVDHQAGHWFARREPSWRSDGRPLGPRRRRYQPSALRCRRNVPHGPVRPARLAGCALSDRWVRFLSTVAPATARKFLMDWTVKMVTLTFVSWNRVVVWLRQIEGLRPRPAVVKL